MMDNKIPPHLWELLDLFEDRSKDKNLGPITRYVWKTAFEELKLRLGERPMTMEQLREHYDNTSLVEEIKAAELVD